MMDPLTLLVSLIGLLIAGMGTWYTYLAYKRGSPSPPNDLPAGNSLLLKLLTYVWQYPERGGNQVTWAVKESFVLRGRLEQARQEPGLGVAIVTTELALVVFGDQSLSRIDGCVAWAYANLMAEFPYLLKGKQIDLRTSQEKVVPDFRHTLAFAIILARSGKMTGLLSGYLRYTMENQNPDGGWSPGEGATVSEVFTVLYATELLSLCSVNERFSDDVRTSAQASRDRAAEWLLLAATEKGLWQSGVLEDYDWDDILTTAWVLHRLAPIKGISTHGWNDCLTRIATSMITKVAKPETWKASGELQRFRIEARVAAATDATLKACFIGVQVTESLEIYLSDWRRRAKAFSSKLSDDDWDVATAVFVLESLFSMSQMKEEIKNSGLTSR